MTSDEFSDIEQLDENLRKWFKEKWVRFGPDGKIRGACARGDDSEGKPKCLPQKKAQNLGKKGRKYAASKKRREDPNPERRGKAKNVATKKKTNEDIPFNECPSCRGPIVHESMLNEKQDACYHKVKSRYKVWPSAYASGALVQCRKKGASNWGTGGKKKNESSIMKGIVDEARAKQYVKPYNSPQTGEQIGWVSSDGYHKKYWQMFAKDSAIKHAKISPDEVDEGIRDNIKKAALGLGTAAALAASPVAAQTSTAAPSTQMTQSSFEKVAGEKVTPGQPLSSVQMATVNMGKQMGKQYSKTVLDAYQLAVKQGVKPFVGKVTRHANGSTTISPSSKSINFEDYTGEFAAEVTPAINPYGGLKDRKHRGMIGETPTDNPTGASGEGGTRKYRPKPAGQIKEDEKLDTMFEPTHDKLHDLVDYEIKNAGITLTDDPYQDIGKILLGLGLSKEEALDYELIDVILDKMEDNGTYDELWEDTAYAGGMGQGGNAGQSYRKFTPKSAGTFKEDEQLDEKCWDSHKQVGMKNKGGRQVPNCVPKESSIMKGLKSL
jgi:hypothetical protein